MPQYSSLQQKNTSSSPCYRHSFVLPLHTNKLSLCQNHQHKSCPTCHIGHLFGALPQADAAHEWNRGCGQRDLRRARRQETEGADVHAWETDAGRQREFTRMGNRSYTSHGAMTQPSSVNQERAEERSSRWEGSTWSPRRQHLLPATPSPSTPPNLRRLPLLRRLASLIHTSTLCSANSAPWFVPPPSTLCLCCLCLDMNCSACAWCNCYLLCVGISDVLCVHVFMLLHYRLGYVYACYMGSKIGSNKVSLFFSTIG